MIGRKSYKFTSFSKKHFGEVTLPKASCAEWPRDQLNKIATDVQPLVVDLLQKYDVTQVKKMRADTIKQYLKSIGVQDLPYCFQIAYNACYRVFTKTIADPFALSSEHQLDVDEMVADLQQMISKLG